MKKISKFSKARDLEPHHQMQFNFIPNDNNSIGPIDVNLTGTTTLGHSGSVSKDDEGVLQIL